VEPSWWIWGWWSYNERTILVLLELRKYQHLL